MTTKIQTAKNIILFLYLFWIGLPTTLKAQEEDQISLNGDWKFYAIYGEGSNYLNIRETEQDIVLDNTNSNVEVFGNWIIKTKGERASTFYGENYLQHNYALTEINGGNKTDSSYVRYYPKFKKSGYYEVFTQFPFSSHLTTQYSIKHAKGATTKYISQRTYCGEWVSLGIYNFNSTEDNYVELSAIVSGAVAADAILFRKIPKEKYLKAKQEPSLVYKTMYDDSDWVKVKVPGHWGTNNAYSNYTGKGWYRRSIALPKGWQQKKEDRYYLKFEGVYHLSKIYLNGQYVGMNRGGFTPFEFDVTPYLNFNGENILAVEADNTAVVGATWNWGGIIRPVTLTRKNCIRIASQYLHAEPNLETGDAAVNIKVKLQNTSKDSRSITLKTKLFKKGEIAEMVRTVTLRANSTETVAMQTLLPKNKVELWHFDHPVLYDFKTEIVEDSKMIDAKEDYFGIRKVELTASSMLFNGEPVRLAGFNRVSESRFWGSSEPKSVLLKDVHLMKEAGANFMRIMHGTQNENLIKICDSLGILLFEEINVRDLDNDEFRAQYYPLEKFKKATGIDINPEEEEILHLDQAYIKIRPAHNFEVKEENYFLAKYWLKGMIERDANRPSVIGWSVGDELNNHFDYGKAAIAYVKENLDPYRLVTCVSNSGQKPEYTPETDPNTFVDLIMHNMYRWQGEPQEILDALRRKWPNKPIFISEYGFDPFSTTAIDGDKAVFSKWMNHFRHQNEFVIGTSMWTFNDYRSGYAGTTAEENRVWGIVTTWRDKRKLFERIQQEHAPVHEIQVTSIDFKKQLAQLRIPIKSRSDYPSYSLKGYQLAYDFVDQKGQTVYKNSEQLPMLHPEDSLWVGEISWGQLPKSVLALNLRLVAPTKHTRWATTVSFNKAITPKIKAVLAGDTNVRVVWDKVPNATAYFVRYGATAKSKKITARTIADFIDIEGLAPETNYGFELYALNDKAESNASDEVFVTTTNKPLPPVIWDAFITDDKLVIGYSSDFEDGDYTVFYGDSPTALNYQFITNVRGMLSIDVLDKEVQYFQLQREIEGVKSIRSQVVKATKQDEH
ncbi:glycoside hydrolase family 2 TIM barrel-domain containing protein [Flavobacterium sp. ASW18X]|uniref:glycoside hydrolase family 2 TIM barrel-domain containing protein n=1 Tax=Flavobacterium sp. ASW18X TaxID=2572595 RepID=UPI0010AEA7EC|nr:glycoside hydrolase family 2 TIM barrel-domain containing protein [Flavobacterium sp. ASW18X]TKD57921.1 glycoside hydrolase family 2 [Flavobacterium sp. ASW18X]